MSGVEASKSSGEAGCALVQTDPLRAAFFLLHAAVIAYVAIGWTMESRWGLFVYTLVVPLMMLQWVLNRGSSIVNNIESYWRTGRWRDPENGLEGVFFQTLLNTFGIRAGQAQINTFVVSALFLFWLTAMFRMVLIVPSLD